MRRSAKQDLLLAVCSKMGEVVPLFTDEECDACIAFLKQSYTKATQSVESVASPAFQKLSLRELLIEKAGVEGKVVQEKKKTPKKPKVALSPRASSKRAVRKRALWSEEEDDEEDRDDAEFDGSFQKKKAKEELIKKPKENASKKPKKVRGELVKPWDAAKHGVVVGVVTYYKEADGLVVDAKVSAHGKSKVHRALVKPEVVDKIKEEHWPKMSEYFEKHDMPASFKATRFAKFCANKK
jgi:hypothetical protein